MLFRRLCCLVVALLLGTSLSDTATAQSSYYVYVASESEDEVALVRFDGQSAEVAQTIPVGRWPTETEGPHGLRVGPEGDYWYLSIAHGQPYGRVNKYRTGSNELIGQVEVGMFPATMDFSAATGLLYVVNFNLHGKPEPSTVSVIDPEVMEEVARIETGPMPHGSRFTEDGRRHYSVAMMSGELFEIDPVTFAVRRRLKTGRAGDDAPKPTWAHPHPTKPLVYVANNGADEIVEVNTEKWEITRRFETAAGPYNLEVSPDGRHLVVSYKTAGETGIWDLETGTERARLPNSRGVTHGVVISPDSRYAFVTAEGKGSERGVVDVFDLEKAEHVATAEVGKQAGGIAFWKQAADASKSASKMPAAG